MSASRTIKCKLKLNLDASQPDKCNQRTPKGITYY